MNELELLLERWANSYLLTSAAAAALIGPLFVVITLAAERRAYEEDTDKIHKIRVYLTPTVFFFASVLVVAALLTFPNHTRLTATLCIGLVGHRHRGHLHPPPWPTLASACRRVCQRHDSVESRGAKI